MHDTKYQLNQILKLTRGEGECAKTITAKIVKIIKNEYKLESPDCQIPIYLSEKTLDRCLIHASQMIGSCQENSDSVPVDGF